MTATQEIIELAYNRFANYYSKKNYYYNEPQYTKLSEDDVKFWTEFIKDVQNNFSLVSKDQLPKPSGKTLNLVDNSAHKDILHK